MKNQGAFVQEPAGRPVGLKQGAARLGIVFAEGGNDSSKSAETRILSHKPGYPLQLLTAEYGVCGVSASIPCAASKPASLPVLVAHIPAASMPRRLVLLRAARRYLY